MLRTVYGWPDPGPERTFDERYAMPNIEALMRDGRWTPLHAFHPTLSYLPQGVVLAAVEACGCLRLGTDSQRVLLAPRPGAGNAAPNWRPPLAAISPLGYRSCRLFQALVSTAAILATFLLARAAAPRIGFGGALGTAAVMAFVPWHVRVAGICNEDALLGLAFVVAGLATLAALRSGTVRSHMVAGAAIGAALATKLTGGAAALPLAGASLWRARREPRRLALLALAGGVAAALFLALNPHFLTDFERVASDFGVTQRLYEREAGQADENRLERLVAGFRALALPSFLGLPLALLALFGALAGARSAAQTRSAPAEGEPLGVLLLFPLTYGLFYGLATGHLPEHNWLPMLPFAAILAMVGAHRLATLAERRAGRVGRLIVSVAVAAAVASVAYRGTVYVYRATVPPTLEVALRALPIPRQSTAILVRDLAADRGYVGPRIPRRGLREIQLVPGGAELDRSRLERADGWVLHAPTAERIFGPESLAGARVVRVGPSLRGARGPEVVARWRPWRLVAARSVAPEKVTRSREPSARLTLAGPAEPATTHRSLRFGLLGPNRPVTCFVELAGGARIEAFAAPGGGPVRRRRADPEAGPEAEVETEIEAGLERRRSSASFFTERVPISEALEVTLRCTSEAPMKIAAPVDVLDWAPPETTPAP